MSLQDIWAEVVAKIGTTSHYLWTANLSRLWPIALGIIVFVGLFSLVRIERYNSWLLEHQWAAVVHLIVSGVIALAVTVALSN